MEPGFVRIVHPGLGPGSISEVPRTGLPQYYLGGWRLLAEDEVPPEPAVVVPEPITIAEVAEAGNLLAGNIPAAAPEEEK